MDGHLRAGGVRRPPLRRRRLLHGRLLRLQDGRRPPHAVPLQEDRRPRRRAREVRHIRARDERLPPHAVRHRCGLVLHLLRHRSAHRDDQDQPQGRMAGRGGQPTQGLREDEVPDQRPGGQLRKHLQLAHMAPGELRRRDVRGHQLLELAAAGRQDVAQPEPRAPAIGVGGRARVQRLRNVRRLRLLPRDAGCLRRRLLRLRRSQPRGRRRRLLHRNRRPRARHEDLPSLQQLLRLGREQPGRQSRRRARGRRASESADDRRPPQGHRALVGRRPARRALPGDALLLHAATALLQAASDPAGRGHVRRRGARADYAGRPRECNREPHGALAIRNDRDHQQPVLRRSKRSSPRQIRVHGGGRERLRSGVEPVERPGRA